MATELQLDSNSVDSGYAAATTPTSDSKDIGIFKQEINSVASLSTSSSAADADPQRLRRRVSLLEKIPREVRGNPSYFGKQPGSIKAWFAPGA